MRDGWRSVLLGDVLSRSNARLGETPEPRVLTVTEGKGVVDQLEHWGRRVAAEDVRSYKVVAPGDVVYNVYLLWNGAIGQNLFGHAGITSPVYEVFRPSPEVEGRFLGLLLESPAMRERFDAISIGTIPRRRRAPWQDFLNLRVNLPPSEEQRRVVDLVGALGEAAAEARSCREAAEGLLNNLRDQVPPGTPATVGSVLTNIVNGVTTTAEAQAAGSGGQRLMKASALWQGACDWEELKAAPDAQFDGKYYVHDGEVLMTRINTPLRVGQLAVAAETPTDVLRPDLVWRLEVDERRMMPSYLVHALSGPSGRRVMTSAASGTSKSMQQISKSRLGALAIGLPTLAQQHEYVARCDAMALCVTRLTDYERRLEAARSAMLAVLLSGEHEIPGSYDELLAG